MRFITIDRNSGAVKSVIDLPFKYEFKTTEGELLIIGHDDFNFDFSRYDYFILNGKIKEVGKK